MGRAAPGVTHVVQTVEACNEVKVGLLNVLGSRLLKAYAIGHSVRGAAKWNSIRGLRRVHIGS